MTQLVYENVFDAITSDRKEAVHLRFRSGMLLALREYFEHKKWTQAQISKILDIPQPRVSELLRGKIDLLSSDKLIGYCGMLGLEFRPKFVSHDENVHPKIEIRSEARDFLPRGNDNL